MVESQVGKSVDEGTKYVGQSSRDPPISTSVPSSVVMSSVPMHPERLASTNKLPRKTLNRFMNVSMKFESLEVLDWTRGCAPLFTCVFPDGLDGEVP